MGTHINARFQKQVGENQWKDVCSNYDERQHYNLFAWLAGVRNYNNIVPIAEMRGCPDDMANKDWYNLLEERPSHWLTGREIIDAIERIVPVTERGVINNWTRFTGKEPDCYSRALEYAKFNMQSDQVKRDTGYAAELWENKCNFQKYDWRCNPHMGVRLVPGTGAFKITHRRVRPSVQKHLNKLGRYMKRVGQFTYAAEWTISPTERLEEFKYFINEVHELMAEHGNIRMLMSFN